LHRGCEIFFRWHHILAKVSVLTKPAMIETAQRNKSAMSIDNISLKRMDGSDLRFDADEFDIVLLRHLGVYVSEIVRVLRPGGYFITKLSVNAVHLTFWMHSVGHCQLWTRLVAIGSRVG